MRYLNCIRYVDREGNPKSERIENVSKDIVDSFQTRSLGVQADFQAQQILAVRAFQKTDVGGALYCNYDNYQ